MGDRWLLSGAVLAGGASRRMGRDKARMVFQGEPLVLRVVRRLQGCCDEVLVVARFPHTYAFTGVACVPDVWPGEGPLAGMFTAALSAAGELLAVVACDMPWVNPNLVRAMARYLHEHPQVDAVVPVAEGREHPLHGVYRRVALLRAAARALQQGQRAIRAAWPHLRLERWPRERWQTWEATGRAFANVNRPEDWPYPPAQAGHDYPRASASR